MLIEMLRIIKSKSADVSFPFCIMTRVVLHGHTASHYEQEDSFALTV